MKFSMLLLLIIIVLVFFGTNIYISCRLYQCFHALIRNLNMLWFGIFCLVLTAAAIVSVLRSDLALSRSVKYALGIYGGYWMGAYVYLLLTFIAADILLLILGALKIIPLPAKASARCISGIAAIVITAVILTAGTVHADHPVHRSYDVKTEKIRDGREWRIVLVSDLHIGAVRSEERLERLVNEINAEKPDVVCIAGDIFDNDFSAILDKEKCAETLGSIDAKYGVYACLGNHDAGKTAKDMIGFLPQCRITLLAESYEVIDKSLILAGRLDSSPIGGYGDRIRGDFSDFMKGADNDLPVIVLDHTPSHIDEYPDSADLILSGHTHRGQIFPGCLITRRLFTVDHGLYRENEASPAVIVTSGAGTWGLPVRVGSDSEIVSVRLTGK